MTYRLTELFSFQKSKVILFVIHNVRKPKIVFLLVVHSTTVYYFGFLKNQLIQQKNQTFPCYKKYSHTQKKDTHRGSSALLFFNWEKHTYQGENLNFQIIQHFSIELVSLSKQFFSGFQLIKLFIQTYKFYVYYNKLQQKTKTCFTHRVFRLLVVLYINNKT